MHRRQFTPGRCSPRSWLRSFRPLARAQAIGTLKMMIPANPGGGWDQTGRALAAAMQSAKVVSSVAVRQQGRRRRARSVSRSSSTRRRATPTR